jgi:hypothetical protein
MMSETRRCCCCGELFEPRSQNPSQTYCSDRACQRARKRAWQRAKRGSDPDYRANDQAAQRAWAQAHPEYWRAWRDAHPEYVARNRAAQRERNARRGVGVIAKEDVKTRETGLATGVYRIEPWTGEDCKRGLVSAENLFWLSAIVPEEGAICSDCKERT